VVGGGEGWDKASGGGQRGTLRGCPGGSGRMRNRDSARLGRIGVGIIATEESARRILVGAFQSGNQGYEQLRMMTRESGLLEDKPKENWTVG